MKKPKKQKYGYVTVRLLDDIIELLEKTAYNRGEKPSAKAREYIEAGLAQEVK